MNDKSHHLATALIDDPNWAAFLYLSDELSVEEARLFEDQLADREDLQLALIETTRQLACLANSDAMDGQFVADQASAPSVINGSEMSWRFKAGAIAAGLVACLAIAVFSSQDSVDTKPAYTEATNTKPADRTPDNREQLSLAATDGIEADTEVLLAWLNIPSEEVVDEDADIQIASDLSVPDWMLTAVLLEAEDLDASEDSSFRSLPPIKNSDSI
ncbi:MAG: hypothetical protein ABJZ55_15365 [Fuerstiella sp.]